MWLHLSGRWPKTLIERTRGMLTLVCGLLLVCGTSCSSSVPDQSRNSAKKGSDWPCFLNGDQNGISVETGIRTDWRDGNLPVAWTRDLGEGYAPGVVANGMYYHFDRIDDQARLVCVDAFTGKLSWEFKYPCDYDDLYGYDGGPRSSPTIDGDFVYVFGVEGNLVALNATTGDVKWEQNINKKFGVHQNFFGVGSPPVVHRNKLLVMVGGSPKENQIRKGQLDEAKPNGTAIVAFDKKTGEKIYQLGNDLASYSAIKLTRHEGRDWAFAWMRDSLIAFDPNNGKIDFEFPWRARILESVNASTPVVFNGHVLLSECYGVGSVLIQFGADLPNKHQVIRKDEGRKKSLMTHWNTPVFDKGFLYASSGRHANGATLRCVDAMSGEVKWSEPGLGRSSVTWVDGHLAIVGERGKVMLAKATSDKFQLVSTYSPGKADEDVVRLRNPCWAAPVIANGMMYIRGKDQVVCFRLVAGAK